MALSCSGKFLKFLVFFFNAIVFIGGGVIACFGIYLLVESKKTGGTVSLVLPAFITAFAIVGILLVAEVICAIVLLVYRHDFVRLVGKEIRDAIKRHEDGSLLISDPTLKALDELQMKTVPPSCCGKESGSCSAPHQIGCAQAMYDEIKDSALAFGIVIIVIGLIQIGAIVCAACLAKKVSEYEKV
ncbi:Leukocyte surface antigen CD53 [Taenia crassiceps]|uniref:Leukocyte surface antigen CD53 n=1 Tax=Taenia crassiceps TaxID=6207 RepID=A0ABR4QM45_9CEST